GQRLLETQSELLLLGVVAQIVQPAQVGAGRVGERRVGQELHDAAQVDRLQFRFGRQCPALGALEQALVDLADDLGIGMANVVKDLRKVRNDVGGAAAVGDDVVDAREVGGVLAQQLGGVIGQLDGAEGGAALLGGGGGVGADAVEAELDRDAGHVR